MRHPTDLDFILTGSTREGGTVYVSQPGADRNTWLAYDLVPGGELTNPRIVFGPESEIGRRERRELC